MATPLLLYFLLKKYCIKKIIWYNKNIKFIFQVYGIFVDRFLKWSVPTFFCIKSYLNILQKEKKIKKIIPSKQKMKSSI